MLHLSDVDQVVGNNPPPDRYPTVTDLGGLGGGGGRLL